MFLSVFQQVHLFSVNRLLMCMIQKKRKICGCATKFCLGFDCLFLWQLFDSIICLAGGISRLHANSCTPVLFSSSALQSSERVAVPSAVYKIVLTLTVWLPTTILFFSFRMCNLDAEWLLYGWREWICSWTPKSKQNFGMGLFGDNCVRVLPRQYFLHQSTFYYQIGCGGASS